MNFATDFRQGLTRERLELPLLAPRVAKKNPVVGSVGRPAWRQGFAIGLRGECAQNLQRAFDLEKFEFVANIIKSFNILVESFKNFYLVIASFYIKFKFFEIGFDQGEDVAGLMREAGLTDVSVKKDLAGLDRVIIGVR